VIVAWTVNILQFLVKYRRMVSVSMDVGICDKCSKYFVTLGKILRTVSISLDIGICVILLHILFGLPIYPHAQTLKLQSYHTTQ
jgi:hypothetical protein